VGTELGRKIAQQGVALLVEAAFAGFDLLAWDFHVPEW
jgi:hypothetical protein